MAGAAVEVLVQTRSSEGSSSPLNAQPCRAPSLAKRRRSPSTSHEETSRTHGYPLGHSPRHRRLEGRGGEPFPQACALRETDPERRHHRRMAAEAERPVDKGPYSLHPHCPKDAGEARHPDRVPAGATTTTSFPSFSRWNLRTCSSSTSTSTRGPRDRYLVLHGDVFDTVTKNFVFLAHLGDWGYRMRSSRSNRAYNARGASWRGLEYWSLSRAIKARVKSAVSHISNFEEHIAELARLPRLHRASCAGTSNMPADKMLGDVHSSQLSGDWIESLTADRRALGRPLRAHRIHRFSAPVPVSARGGCPCRRTPCRPRA